MRTDPAVFLCPAQCQTESGHHLVEDQQDAVALSQALEAGQETGRRLHDPLERFQRQRRCW
jgi:hypothetical protein